MDRPAPSDPLPAAPCFPGLRGCQGSGAVRGYFRAWRVHHKLGAFWKTPLRVPCRFCKCAVTTCPVP